MVSEPEKTEIYCENCGTAQLPATSLPACPKCGGQMFGVRLITWAKPLTTNDKRFLKSMRISSL